MQRWASAAEAFRQVKQVVYLREKLSYWLRLS